MTVQGAPGRKYAKALSKQGLSPSSLEQAASLKTKACRSLVTSGRMLPPEACPARPLTTVPPATDWPGKSGLTPGGSGWSDFTSKAKPVSEFNQLLHQGWQPRPSQGKFFEEVWGGLKLLPQGKLVALSIEGFLLGLFIYLMGGCFLLCFLAIPKIIFQDTPCGRFIFSTPFWWVTGGLGIVVGLTTSVLALAEEASSHYTALPPQTVLLRGPESWQALQGDLLECEQVLTEKHKALVGLGLQEEVLTSPLWATYKEELAYLLRKAQDGGGLAASVEGEDLDELREALETVASPYFSLVEESEAALQAHQDKLQEAQEHRAAKTEALEEALKQAAEEADRPLREWEEALKKEEVRREAEALKEGLAQYATSQAASQAASSAA